VCNAVVKMARFQKTGVRVASSGYKSKGDALECGSYKGIKMLKHILKIFERITEVRESEKVKFTTCSLAIWEAKEPHMPFK